MIQKKLLFCELLILIQTIFAQNSTSTTNHVTETTKIITESAFKLTVKNHLNSCRFFSFEDTHSNTTSEEIEVGLFSKISLLNDVARNNNNETGISYYNLINEL